jgi:hypothetical protein
MKKFYSIILIFLLHRDFVQAQWTTNTAGDIYNAVDYSVTFTLGETVNDMFSTSDFSLKAGVIQSFVVICPLPAVFDFLPINDLCLQTGASKAIVLSNSENNVGYQLIFNGTLTGEKVSGTGGPLSMILATEPGVYAVRAGYSGRTCFVDMPQQISLNRVPALSLSQGTIPCEDQPLSLTYQASEPLSLSYNINGETKSAILTATSGNLNLSVLSKPSSLTFSGVKSLQSGCTNPVSGTLSLSVTAKPGLGAINLDICSNESFSLPLSSNSNVRVNWTATYNGLTGGLGSGAAAVSLNELLTNNTASPLTATYVLTPFISNNPSCQGNPVTSSVRVNPPPEIIIPAINTTYCSGELFSIPVKSNGTGTLLWSRDNGASIGNGTIAEAIENTSGQSRTVVYTMNLEGGICRNVPGKTLSLTILPAPVLQLKRIPSLCDAFIDLTAPDLTAGSSANLSLSYFRDAQLSVPLANPDKVSQGTYFVKGQLGTCFVSAPVSIKAQIKLKVNDPQTVCPNQKTDLTDPAITSGSSSDLSLSFWQDAAATQALSVPNSVEEGTYYIKAEGLTPSGTCSVVKPVVAKSFRPSLLNPPANLSVCSGSIFSYTPQTKDAAFSWFRNASGALGLPGASGANEIRETLEIKSPEDAVTLTYGYSLTAPGCAPGSSTFEVVVNKGPNFQLVDSVQICDSYTNLNGLIKSATGDVSFRYLLNDAPVSDVTKGIQGLYRVEGVSARGCKTVQSIEVKHKISVPALAPLYVCPPRTFDLKAKIGELFASNYDISFEDIPMPEKVAAGNYTVRLSEKTGSCRLILPLSLVSAEAKWSNPVSSTVVCSNETFSLEPSFTAPGMTWSWDYANGKGSGKLEAAWINTTVGTIVDSIKIVTASALCNQATTSFIRVEVLPSPPSLQISAPEVCSDKLLSIGVAGIPENPLARFKWSAAYGPAEGGSGGRAINSFGPTAIRELLTHEEDTVVLVTYQFQGFLSGAKSCFGPVASVQVSVLPPGFGTCTANIAGTIQTINKQKVEGVTVQISGFQSARSVFTRKDGLFKISGLEPGFDYSIYPELNKFPLNGVSTYDILLLQKHLINARSITNPYELIAADVNKSGNISISDVLQLRRLILGLEPAFPQNTSWRFVDASYKFRDEANPYVFPEVRNFNDLEGSAEAHFVGIKVGDLNGSVVANSGGTAEPREQNFYRLQAENKKVNAGDYISLVLRTDEKEPADGLQLTLQYDTEQLSFHPSGFDPELKHFVGVFENEGLLTLSWANALLPNSLFLSLPFRVNKSGETAAMFSVSDRITRAEAYVGGKILPIDIAFPSKAELLPMLLSPYPNPFIDQVTIPYFLVTEKLVTLKIMDVSGRLVQRMTREGRPGKNHFFVTNLPAGSEWTFEMSTDDWKSTGKLISVAR